MTSLLLAWLPILFFCLVTGFLVTDVMLIKRNDDEDDEDVNLSFNNEYDYLDSIDVIKNQNLHLNKVRRNFLFSRSQGK